MVNMGPKKVVSKDDSQIDTKTGNRFDEIYMYICPD